MQQALYAPNLGYYNSNTTKFGKHGDFITAPELGDIFAKCLAQQCAQILHALPNKQILEFGAGSGQLACDLLLSLADLKVLPDTYFIIELSASLKLRQQQKIQQQCPHLFDKIVWLDQLPATPINGVIIANEVLDAMPATRFGIVGNKLYEQYVQINNTTLEYLNITANPDLQALIQRYELEQQLSANQGAYFSEVNLWIPAWISSISAILNQGLVLLFDYGFGRSEYYHPQRSNGTLMCHFRHHAHSDPFYLPGLQDITTHVDFSAVAEAADQSNLQVQGYTSLAGFLINCGISSFIALNPQQSQEINTLCSTAEMGEIFKAIALTKNIEESLLGFSHYDKLHHL
jgi:SAM-dependent MidA family methyltransferase